MIKWPSHAQIANLDQTNVNNVKAFSLFCEQYVHIYSPTRGFIPLQLYKPQEQFYNYMTNNRHLLISKDRQGGFTTIALVYCLWQRLHNSQMRLVWLARAAKEVDAARRIWCDMIDNLPFSSHLHDMIDFLPIGTDLQSYESGIDLLIMDEVAFMYGMTNDDWVNIVKHVSAKGKILIMSTMDQTKDYNWFRTMYNATKDGDNEFKLFEPSNG